VFIDLAPYKGAETPADGQRDIGIAHIKSLLIRLLFVAIAVGKVPGNYWQGRLREGSPHENETFFCLTKVKPTNFVGLG
jgi:hypothetical protein